MFAYITLVILLSGFNFTTRYPKARFKQLRSNGWSLYCHIFSWGSFWGFVSFSLIWYFHDFFNSLSIYLTDIPALLKEYNINNDLIFWSCLTVLLSFIFGFITSKVPFCQKQGLKESNKESELRSKIYDSTQNGEFVQVTLNSRKVYVGVIVRNINEFVPTDSECIVISPYRSGYRDKDTLVINFTNEYTLQHQEYIKTIKLKAWFRLNRIVSNYSFFNRKLFAFKYRKNNPNTMYFKYLQRFAVVIPVSDIASISYFDLEVFKNINNNTCSKDNL